MSRGFSTNSKTSLEKFAAAKPRAQSSLGFRGSTKQNQITYLISANAQQMKHYKKSYAKDISIFEIPQSQSELDLPITQPKSRKKSNEKQKQKRIVSKSSLKKKSKVHFQEENIISQSAEQFNKPKEPAFDENQEYQSNERQQQTFEEVLYQKELKNMELQQEVQTTQAQIQQQPRYPLQNQRESHPDQQQQNQQISQPEQNIQQLTPQLQQILDQIVPNSMSTQNGNNIQMPGGVYKNRIENQSQFFHLENVTINTGPILTAQASKHSSSSRHNQNNDDQAAITSQVDPNLLTNTEPIQIDTSPQGICTYRDLNQPQKKIIMAEAIQGHEKGKKSASDIQRVSESLNKGSTPEFELGGNNKAFNQGQVQVRNESECQNDDETLTSEDLNIINHLKKQLVQMKKKSHSRGRALDSKALGQPLQQSSKLKILEEKMHQLRAQSLEQVSQNLSKNAHSLQDSHQKFQDSQNQENKTQKQIPTKKQQPKNYQSFMTSKFGPQNHERSMRTVIDKRSLIEFNAQKTTVKNNLDKKSDESHSIFNGLSQIEHSLNSSNNRKQSITNSSQTKQITQQQNSVKINIKDNDKNFQSTILTVEKAQKTIKSQVPGSNNELFQEHKPQNDFQNLLSQQDDFRLDLDSDSDNQSNKKLNEPLNKQQTYSSSSSQESSEPEHKEEQILRKNLKIFKESKCEKFIDIISQFQIETKSLRFSEKLSIGKFEKTSEELESSSGKEKSQMVLKCHSEKIMQLKSNQVLVKQQDLFVIMLNKQQGVQKHHQNFIFHLSLNYKRMFNQKSVFNVDFDFEANKHIFTKKLDKVLRQIHKVDRSHDPQLFMRSNASPSVACVHNHKHVHIQRQQVSKPSFKKLIQIYDLNLNKCTSSNNKAKRRNNQFLQEDLAERNREKIKDCCMNIFSKLEFCIKNMSLSTHHTNDSDTRFLIQEIEWFNLSEYRQLRKFRLNTKFLYEFSALQKGLMRREYYHQLVHKNREQVCNYIKLTKPDQLEKISRQVTLFDIKTKISRNYFIYSEINWSLLTIQSEKFQNKIRKIYLSQKKMSQSKQLQIDAIVSKNYLETDSCLHKYCGVLEPKNFRCHFHNVPQIIKLQLIENLLMKKVYNMIYNHKIGVVHQAIRNIFNYEMVPAKFDPLSKHYQNNCVILKSKDVNVFAARYLTLLTEFSENQASIYFKANYKDIAKLLVSQSNHNDLYSQMHDHQLDYYLVLRIKHLKNNLRKIFLPKTFEGQKSAIYSPVKKSFNENATLNQIDNFNLFEKLDLLEGKRRGPSSRAETRGNLRRSYEIIEDTKKLQPRSNSYTDGSYDSRNFILQYNRQDALNRYSLPYKLNYISTFVKKNKFIMESKADDQAVDTLINKNDKGYSDLTWNFGFKTEHRRNEQFPDQIYSVYRQKILKDQIQTVNIYDKLTGLDKPKSIQVKTFYKKFKKRTQQKIMDAIKVDEIQTDESMKDLYLEDFNLDELEPEDPRQESQSNTNSNKGGVKVTMQDKQLAISRMTKQDGSLEHYQKLRKLREQKEKVRSASVILGKFCVIQKEKVFEVEQIQFNEEEQKFAAQKENRLKVEKMVNSTVDAVYLDNREQLHNLHNDIDYYKRRLKKRRKLQKSPKFKRLQQIHSENQLTMTAKMDKQQMDVYQKEHDKIKQTMVQNYAKSNLQEFTVLQDAHLDTSNEESPELSLGHLTPDDDNLFSEEFQKQYIDALHSKVSKLVRQNCKTSATFEEDPLLLGNEIKILKKHKEQQISKWEKVLLMRDIKQKARKQIDTSYKDAYQKIRERNEKDKAQLKYSEIIKKIFSGLNIECQIFTDEALEIMRVNQNQWKKLISQKRKQIKIIKKDNRNLVFKVDEHQVDHRINPQFDILNIKKKLFNAVKKRDAVTVKTTLQRYTLSHEDVIDSSGNTLIIMAAINNDFDMISLLLKMGLSPNGQNEDGNSALHFAINGNYRKCIDTLITYGADESVYNNKGKTPWELAQNP